MVYINLVNAGFPRAQNIHFRGIADHDAVIFSGPRFQQGVFKNFGMGLQAIGSFGSNDLLEKNINTGSLQFVMLGFSKPFVMRCN